MMNFKKLFKRKKAASEKEIITKNYDYTNQMNSRCGAWQKPQNPDGGGDSTCTYYGDDCYVYHPDTTIGKYTSIAHRVLIGAGQHPTNWLSMSPAFWDTCPHENETARYSGFLDNIDINEMNLIKWRSFEPVKVGNDVWIGANVVIMDGLTIGDGAVIASNAVVTKDVEPYAIVAGVPAKLIRKRFSEDIIEKLLDIKWWNLQPELVKDLPFNNIIECVNILEERKNNYERL